jgi:proteic killer suppression protein
MHIRTFRHKGLRRLYEDDDTRGFSPGVAQRVRNILSALDVAETLHQIAKTPGWRFHSLRGDRIGLYSVRVTANWRITFRAVGLDVFDVDLEDYH